MMVIRSTPVDNLPKMEKLQTQTGANTLYYMHPSPITLRVRRTASGVAHQGKGTQPMSKRILIVDDDINIRRIVTLALTEDSSYIVSSVSSGEAALLHISRQPVDLLFTDIKMPGMDGLELVRRVRELDPDTAVIVFTVSPQDLSPERATELKVDCLLEKPISPDQLRLAVDLLLDPTRLAPSTNKPKPASPAPPPQPAAPETPAAPARPKARETSPLNQAIAQRRRETAPLNPAPVAVRLGGRGTAGRSYSEGQIEAMRAALKELAMEPGVHSALLADMSGIVLTHWSRYRDINVTVVAALAAGNSLALAEIGRNMGQRQPGRLVIQEGDDQSILMAHMEDLLLLLALSADTSLGWARIATMRACEEILRIAHGD